MSYYVIMLSSVHKSTDGQAQNIQSVRQSVTFVLKSKKLKRIKFRKKRKAMFRMLMGSTPLPLA